MKLKKLLAACMAPFIIGGCGSYVDYKKKDKAKDKKLTISERYNLDNVKDGGIELCYTGMLATTEIMKNLFPVGVHELEITDDILEEIKTILGDRMPKKDSFSTNILPDAQQLLASNGIDLGLETNQSISIRDWDFGAVTVGKHHIFFNLDKDSLKPFYTDKYKERYGVPLDREPTSRERAKFISLLAHELTHIVQMTQPKAKEKVSKSCVIQYDVTLDERYDYSISTVNDLFKLGMEASARFVGDTVLLGEGFESSDHDLEKGDKNIESNFKQHIDRVHDSTGF